MVKKILLFVFLASWLAACESSGGGGGAATTPEITPPDDMSLSDAWQEDRDSLPELEGHEEWRNNSVIDPQAAKHYVLGPVMEMNRKMGQATYNSPVLNRLVQEIESGDAKKEAKELFESLFGDLNLNNQTRYQKQLKCLADIHEFELTLQSLLIAAHDPALREGVFKPLVLEELAALDTEEERVEQLIDLLWLEEDGRSDLIEAWQRYRNKIAAFLVLPLGDEDMYSNAWSCTLTNESWGQFAEGPTFADDVKSRWEGWQQPDQHITRATMADELQDLIGLVQEVRQSSELASYSLGAMNEVVLNSALTEEPEQENGSHEGSLYRMGKLVCKGFWNADDTSSLCAEDEKSFVGTFQITRDVSEQIASNAADALSWIIYDGGLARELHKRYAKADKPKEAKDRKAQKLVDAIVTLKEQRLDPLAQRAHATLADPSNVSSGSGGCKAAGYCERSLLTSVADANNSDLAVREKKPGYNHGAGETAFPIDDDNKNVLRHERVEDVMKLIDEGVIDYLEEVEGAVDELIGSWNHLITLLLIGFGALRLRSRRH